MGVMFYMAEKYNIKCHGLTLSIVQAEYIEKEIERRKLDNLVSVEVKNIHDMSGEYDYAISVGVMEHIKDYDGLYQKISKTLKQEGKALVHTMFHREIFHKTDPFFIKIYISRR